MGAALEQDSNRKTFYIENLIRHKQVQHTT